MKKQISYFFIGVLILTFVFFFYLKKQRGTSSSKRNYIFHSAEANTVELEKVLKHYRTDSLKQQAALFLIANMKDKSEISWKARTRWGLDTSFQLTDYANESAALRAKDSLGIWYYQDTVKMDIQNIESTFLINHIDKTFQLWKHSKWARWLNFSQFCEYLLPYRVSSEPLEDWISYLSTNYSKCVDSTMTTQEALIALNDTLKNKLAYDSRWLLYPASMQVQEMDSLGKGNCSHLANFATKVLRALGIPSVNDYTPAWSSYYSGHEWNALITPKGTVPFGIIYDMPEKFKLPRKTAKIYRKSFAIQRNCIWECKTSSQQIPLFFQNNHLVDVSHEYGTTFNFSLPLDSTLIPNYQNCIFLCVDNGGTWTPIDWGRIKNGQAHFSNVLGNVLLAAVYYQDGQLTLTYSPFLLSNIGEVLPLEPDYNHAINLDTITMDKYFIKKELSHYQLEYFDKGWQTAGFTKVYQVDNEDLQYTFKGFQEVPSNTFYRIRGAVFPFIIREGKCIELSRWNTEI